MDVFKKDIENKIQPENKIIWGRDISDTRNVMLIQEKVKRVVTKDIRNLHGVFLQIHHKYWYCLFCRQHLNWRNLNEIYSQTWFLIASYQESTLQVTNTEFSKERGEKHIEREQSRKSKRNLNQRGKAYENENLKKE